MAIRITVNGTEHELDVPEGMPLLWVLRDRIGLTGTKYACGVAQCGACMVHVDGTPRPACIIPIETLEGAEITTIEGVSGPEADAVRAAWREIDVPQCGYCQSGQIMSAIALLRDVKDPSDDDIDQQMSQNLCRCATYMRIRQAIKDAASTI